MPDHEHYFEKKGTGFYECKCGAWVSGHESVYKLVDGKLVRK